jgi:hypothetical protein
VTAVLVVAALLPLSGCDQQMVDMPRSEPFEASAVLPQATSAQPLVPGTVARGAALLPRPEAIPFEVTRERLERGRERYEIFCAPCHSLTGNGDGMIVQRGFPAPPSYHIDRLRTAPDAYLFDVITHGYGVMYSYAARVPAADRWAIVSYLRALQLSQHAPVSVLPDDVAAGLPEVPR